LRRKDRCRCVRPYNARVATNKRVKKRRPLAETQGDLGRVLYRAGEFDAAVRELEEALELQKGDDFPTFLKLAFLAMAQQRLGHAEEAGRRMGEAAKTLEKAGAPEATPAPWHVRVAAQRVRKEGAVTAKGERP
jgi:tetratricopeptide (TPR) repeat protein